MSWNPWKKNWVRWWTNRLLAAAALYAGAYTFLNWHFNAAVEQELAWVRAQGAPVASGELMQPEYRREVPSGEDAAPLLRAAIALYDGISEADRNFCGEVEFKDGMWHKRDAGSGSLSDEEIGRLKNLARENRQILEILAQAAARPHCGSQVDFAMGFSALLPHVSKCRGLLMFLRIPCAISTLEGNPSEAADRWLAGLSVLRLLEADPYVLVSHLVSVAIERMQLGSLQQVMRCASFPEADLARIQKAIGARPSSSEAWKKAVWGERALGGHLWQAYLNGSDTADNPGRWRARGLSRIWMQADYLWYLRYFRFIESRESSLVTKGAMPGSEEYVKNLPAYAILTRWLLPAVEKVYARTSELSASRLVTQWGIQLCRHRQRTGSYPASLEMLDPGLRRELPDPTDPFTGKPLLYRRERGGEGFLLYSVGRNLKDDGGKPLERWAPAGDDDILFQLSK